MARRLSAISALIMTCLAAAGCESSGTSSALPSPNFAGPVVIAQRPQIRLDPPLAYRPPAVQGKSTARTNVPAAWVPLASADKRKWNWIVIHHSAGPTGSAAAFDKYHREVNKWDELGYHFVIGNGSGSGDGQIEVGPRWPRQKHGAHAKTPDNQYNDHGIGICLVGNFDVTRPTAKQMQSLARLTAYLADTYGVSQRNIIGHKMTGKQTDCPGKNMDIATIRAAVARLRTAMADETPATEFAGELMQSASQ